MGKERAGGSHGRKKKEIWREEEVEGTKEAKGVKGKEEERWKQEEKVEEGGQHKSRKTE